MSKHKVTVFFFVILSSILSCTVSAEPLRTWVSGSNTVNQYGVYGTKGVAASGNVPGARAYSVSWTDSSGNFWLFGGRGYTASSYGMLNDLWKFDGANWTWVSGSNATSQYGVYGTKGLAVPGNVPGARNGSVSWIDAGGNLWLFGGWGYAASGVGSYLNDLWKFDGTNWIWVSGSNMTDQFGVYGTKGVAASDNMPGARNGSVSWIDAGGNLWLFGGSGYAANDLWKFDGTDWTWVSGSDTNQYGVYGTKGLAAPGNVPGTRADSVSWIDSSGNFWLFGGIGYAASGSGYLNDLWKFDGTNWTWVSGSNATNQYGVYGTKGISASGNVPGARYDSVLWSDSSGSFWLFGGEGYAASGSSGSLNDLWKFDGVSWTWISGSDATAQLGVYGTKGVAAPGNVPGARAACVSWIDSSRNIWLFGGGGYATSGYGRLNDLWKFDLPLVIVPDVVGMTQSAAQSAIVAAGLAVGTVSNTYSSTVPAGSVISQAPAAGSTVAVGSSVDIEVSLGPSTTVPDVVGMTQSAAQSAIVAASLVVGTVSNEYSSTVPAGSVISQSPASGSTVAVGSVVNIAVSLGAAPLWTWVSGSDAIDQYGIYGTKGLAAPGNVPGARWSSVSWTDSSGNFWLFGGSGYAESGSGYLNDLWKFDGASWTWVSGESDPNLYGVYGTKGLAASGNVPGSRYRSVSWIDSSGNLWLFGGVGYAASGSAGHLNDLWKFDGANWTWVSGSDATNQYGEYGTKGIAAPDNMPGARYGSVSWIDAGGDLWLFGGWGYAASSYGYLNDLWKFDGTSWTWVSGSSDPSQYGVYGTKGAAASGNVPGARFRCVSWTDTSGNLWLFGGYGRATSDIGYLNDLWKFDGTDWTWVSGSSDPGQPGVYGTKGAAASDNVPGARNRSVSWIDAGGDLWLFGGMYEASGIAHYLNDLWKFDGTNWTWVSGSSAPDQYGVYGTKGVPASDNVPGARWRGVSWIDSSGNLWLFGGSGYAASGSSGRLNDLWKVFIPVSVPDVVGMTQSAAQSAILSAGLTVGTVTNSYSSTVTAGSVISQTPTAGSTAANGSAVNIVVSLGPDLSRAMWTWVSGSNVTNQAGVYGTKGLPAPGNVPGGRWCSVSWTDPNGKLWLFGGNGYAAGGSGRLNDLWEFDGTNWIWVSGSNAANQPGIYGTKGVAASGNVPGARSNSVSWIDPNGTPWFFGGVGYAASTYGELNDLWKFDGTNWTWVSGSNATDQPGVYGTKGVAAPGNVPGAREFPISWIDPNGSLWLFGGDGYAASGSGLLNDLWKFDGANWTWVSGSSEVHQYGVYGTKGVAASGNVPGARSNSVSWIDPNGSLWLFGGIGYAAGNYGELNDLWRFDGTNWTWVSGSNAIEQYGVYGIKGVAAPGNVPGVRYFSVSWLDAGGNLWLFGGFGYAASGSSGYLNDLWKFDGANWTWVGGSSATSQYGVYGPKGVAASGNVPGARVGSISWIDNGGSLWLFGGQGYAASGSSGLLNDLWRFGIPELVADINEDGIVNYLDLRTLIDQWLTNPTGTPSADIAPFPAGDDIVNFRDFAVLASQWMLGI